MFRVTVDLSGFRTEATRTRNELVRTCSTAPRAAALAGRDEAKRAGRFKDRTGRLRGSITARHEQETARGAVWQIVSPTPYSLYVEAGTRPHVIEARRAPMLRFYWEREGKWFVGKRVNHPGTHATPFMGPGYLKAEAVLRARIDADIARIAAQWR